MLPIIKEVNTKGGIVMFCQKCGKEISDDATYCIHCGCAVETGSVRKNRGNVNSTEKTEEVSVLLILLSLFIPIAGIIVGDVRYNEHPDTSKIYIWCGVGAFIFSSIVLAFC